MKRLVWWCSGLVASRNELAGKRGVGVNGGVFGRQL